MDSDDKVSVKVTWSQEQINAQIPLPHAFDEYYWKFSPPVMTSKA